MPTRLIRDGVITSDRIDRLSPAAEVCYYRLLLTADDYGRHDARPPILLARMYPLRLNRVTAGDVVGWLDECEVAGLIRRYVVDGRPYLEIPRFDQRIRAKRPKYPPPPDDIQPDDRQMTGTCQADDGHVSDTCRLEAQARAKAKAKARGCTEPDEPATVPPHEPPAMVLPTRGGGEWPLPPAKVREWQSAYPALDVLGELRRARQWLIDHPARGKTGGGMTRYLAGWLSREHDSVRAGGGRPPPTTPRTSECPDLPTPRRG